MKPLYLTVFFLIEIYYWLKEPKLSHEPIRWTVNMDKELQTTAPWATIGYYSTTHENLQEWKHYPVTLR